MKIDLAKRRQVMERSVRLGHCICEPRRPCPCDVFTGQGICPCAGERPEPMQANTVKLTSMVRNPGCASKIPAADLEEILSRLPKVEDPRVLSGLAAADDAAIYRISENLCLVQTVDVFSPCVDDPTLFGRICAANCLSDVYAMGGEPRTALSILGFPSESLPGEIMGQMLGGAMQVFAEAGVALVGGHSIKDSEVKLGFAITGVIDPNLASSLDSPKVGDLLVLTKPLGTGVLGFAQQLGRAPAEGLAAAAESMTRLNRDAAEAMREAGASACTDITGFGLFGHLYRMLRNHGLCATVNGPALPVFPGVLELLRKDIISGAIERNREFVGAHVSATRDVDEAYLNLGFDAQTSGGLLIAVAPSRLKLLEQSCAKRGINPAIIGEILTGPTAIRVTALSAGLPAPEPSQVGASAGSNDSEVQPDHSGCCSDVFGTKPASGNAIDSQRAFAGLMRAVAGKGQLDPRAKELIIFGLVLQSRCHGCFESHYKRALELGITRAEMDEVAWCAIAMGGAPVKIFYEECCEKAGI